MKILICNAGSTSLKFKLYEMPDCTVLAKCKIERIGSDNDAVFQYQNLVNGQTVAAEKQNFATYQDGLQAFLDCLTEPAHGVLKDIREIARVGYKAALSKNHFGVHALTETVLKGMRDWLPLATLHNTAYLRIIEVMRTALPEALFVGAFETGFHREIPLARRLYGVPYEWYDKYGVQRLGYHSASHGYIADVLNARYHGTPYKAISCHLGGSSSICAIENGKSIDTSFGMSLQSGLPHATRVGDMDCDLFAFLRSEGLTDAEIQDGFEKSGGLLGISGVSGDLRYIQQAADAGNTRAALAIDVFVNKIVHYIGAFYLDLGGLDALVFTAGIGENAPRIRQMVCEKLAPIGVCIDAAANCEVCGAADVTGAGSRVRVLVIPTDEELGIARRTYDYETEEDHP